MVAISILYFITVTTCLSFLTDLFAELKGDVFEQFFMRIGLGLAYLSVLGIILDLLFIPINAYIILAISFIFPAISYYKKPLSKKKISHLFNITNKKKTFYLILTTLFLITAFMYIGGSFSYPYMEDGDPWGYTAVSKVISEEQTIKAEYRYNHYSEPYTQGYQIVMGVLHQTNDSMYVNMKFFHNLILSLSIIFFYFLTKKILPKASEELALAGAIVLFAIPSWVTKFIFSLNYNMVIFLIFLYALFQIDKKGWKIITGILLGSILINHAFTAMVTIIILALIYFFKTIHTKTFNLDIIEAGYIGLITAALFYIPTSLRHTYYFDELVNESHGGLEKVLYPLVNNTILWLPLLTILIIGALVLWKKQAWIHQANKLLNTQNLQYYALATFYFIILILTLIPRKLLEIEGTASRAYTFNDFWAANPSMINNTVGFGPIIFILLSIAILVSLINFKKLFHKNNLNLFISINIFFALLWLVFGANHSILFMTFRIWTFLAIFASILAAYGLYLIYDLLTKQGVNKTITYGLLLLLISIMIWTTFLPKYEHNAGIFPDHRIWVPDSYPTYNYIRSELPKDSAVVRICGNNYILAAYDAYPPLTDPRLSPQWRGGPEKTIGLHQEIYDLSTNQIYEELSNKNIDYLVGGASCIVRNQERQQDLLDLLNRLNEDPRFQIEFGTETEILFSIN